MIPRRGLQAALLALLCLAFLLTSGCGYHTGGAAVRLPTDLHVLYVPTFGNTSPAYQVQQTVTQAVVRELRNRTHYQVVSTNDGDYDAELLGTITSLYIAPLTYDSVTGRVSSSIVVMTLNCSLTNRQGRVLWSNPNYLYREQFQESIDAASFFDEAGPAVQRVANSFSKTLVSDILESY